MGTRANPRPNSSRSGSQGGRCFLFALAVGALCLAAGVVAYALLGNPAGRLGPGAADLNPAERGVLLAILTARANDLTTPAGLDATPIVFTVEPGETAGGVAERLAEAGLVHDAQLLSTYLRYQGLDSQVEAGDFILRTTMTIPQVARALTDAQAREVLVRMVEGWRIEQIAEMLSQHSTLSHLAGQFLVLAGPGSPRPNSVPLVAELSPGASLEGYLFPDTYLLSPQATASDLITKMLGNFEAQLPPDYRTQVATQGITLHQAVTVASLIEREAVVDEERPLIASVIYNRLAIGQLLEIDAATQYVLGQSGNWWPRLGGLDLRSIVSPYNTYAQAGLPPGPVANPGLQSLLAAANPATTAYYYYRALCDGSGRHAFAETYEQHIANACR